MSSGRRRLTSRDYHTDPVTLAQRLLGAVLVRSVDGRHRAGRIVETEAYCGPDDLAAHSVGARRTPRTEPMFGPPGTSYVFLTYGMHHCFNVVCGAVDMPVAVLIRALEPTENLDAMRTARTPARTRAKTPKPLRDKDLCSGPAKLCQALAIDRTLNAIDLTADRRLWIEAGPHVPVHQIVNDARIGVEYAGAWSTALLRWYDRASAHVSRRAKPEPPPRRSTAARPA